MGVPQLSHRCNFGGDPLEKEKREMSPRSRKSGIKMSAVSKMSLLIFVVFAWFFALTAKLWQVNDHRKSPELTMNQSKTARFRRPGLLMWEKSSCPYNFLPAILGLEMAAPILWTPGKNGVKGFLVFLGGECRFYFYGREDFLITSREKTAPATYKCTITLQRKSQRCTSQILRIALHFPLFCRVIAVMMSPRFLSIAVLKSAGT